MRLTTIYRGLKIKLAQYQNAMNAEAARPAWRKLVRYERAFIRALDRADRAKRVIPRARFLFSEDDENK